ncbi:MAG TPA: hypothetical protein VFP84_20590 [Kofleriaceae bacterium]|nr:hypothetical protein [Kofleriaceae bacterium]
MRAALPIVLASVLAGAAVARGEPIAGTGDAPRLIDRPLTLGAGQLEARLALELPAGGGERPVSIAPDAWIGVTDRLTVGVIHSDAALDQVATGASLCLRGGKPLTCDHVYRGGGLDAVWRGLDGPVQIAPRARFVIRDVDPWKPAATLGALVRWTRGAFAIYGDPYLRIGLANTDLGNRSALVVPIWLAVQPAERAVLALHTGWTSDLAVIRDGWHVPVALDVTARASARLDVGLEAGFASLLGPQNSVKNRALTLSVAFRP